MTDTRERIWGAYVGCALGDAFGMPTELCTRAQLENQYPRGISDFLPSRSDDALARELAAGEITDDTINTIMIHEMIVNHDGAIDTRAYIDQLIAWSHDSSVAAFVSGPSTVKALRAISAGEPIERTGISGTTNGASMKISPIGVLDDYRDPDHLISDVFTICQPTHNTRVAIQGAAAVAAAVSYGVRGGHDVAAAWDIALEFIDRSETVGFDFPSASLRFRMDMARAIIESGSEKRVALSRLYTEVGTGMETLQSIPSAFAIVALADGDAVHAAQLSAMVGWDTDTIGAISSAICGAMNPVIPQRFVERLEKVNAIDFRAMADAILPFIQMKPRSQGACDA